MFYKLKSGCYWLIAGLSFVCLTRCSDFQTKKKEVVDSKQHSAEKREVAVQVLQEQPFKQELLSNGKLRAELKSILAFEVGGHLEELFVQNGNHVQKGQALARLDAFKYRQALANAEIAWEKTRLDFEDMLVSRGYNQTHKDSIPKDIYKMATIRSGYNEAKNQLENALFDLNAVTLKAPFSGKVASLQYKQYEWVAPEKEIMTLIDDSAFEVEFYLIEAEIHQIEVGQAVEVLTFNAGPGSRGKVVNINPQVEENGMVLVKAQIKNTGQLMEGMNVKVRIEKDLPGQLVVPKSAVLLRDDQEVLFKFQNGKAYWTYVQTIHENSNSYAVRANPDKSNATLQAGDTIIISGNLNLAHDSEVEIVQINSD